MKHRGLLASLAFLIGLAITRAAPQAPATPAEAEAGPDATGITLVRSVCGGCHAASSILGEHRTRHDWTEILEWMANEGAVMNDEEYEQMLRFLSVRYGLVAVNTAEAEDVQAVLELNDEQIGRLVAARSAGTSFRNLDDLSRTIGVPAASLESRKARIDFAAP